jgi:magnesium transporter
MTFELTKYYLEQIEAAIEARDEVKLRAEMDELYPADINTILEELDTEPAHYVFSLLDKEIGAEIMADIDATDRKRFLTVFTSEEIASYVEYFDSDDAVDLLKEQPIRIREEVIAHLKDKEQARFILDLLPYDEDVAGGLMQKELIKANINWTVNECIEEIRKQAEDVENVYSVYVVDDNQILMGLLSLKKIVLARKNTKIENIYDDDVVKVETYRPIEEVVEIMQRYDLDAMPVVNVQGRLLGRITIDDIVDVITEKAEDDIQAFAGLGYPGSLSVFVVVCWRLRLSKVLRANSPKLRPWLCLYPSWAARAVMWVFRRPRSLYRVWPISQGWKLRGESVCRKLCWWPPSMVW